MMPMPASVRFGHVKETIWITRANRLALNRRDMTHLQTLRTVAADLDALMKQTGLDTARKSGQTEIQLNWPAGYLHIVTDTAAHKKKAAEALGHVAKPVFDKKHTVFLYHHERVILETKDEVRYRENWPFSALAQKARQWFKRG